MTMNLNITLDSAYDEATHYIIPGGYEFQFETTVINFDFQGSSLSFNGSKRQLHFELFHPELVDGPAEHLRLLDDIAFLKTMNRIEDCYVFTGEDDEPELNVVSVDSISFMTDTGDVFNVPQELLDQWNQTYAA